MNTMELKIELGRHSNTLTGIRFKAAGRSTHLGSSCFCGPEQSNDIENVISSLWVSNKTHIVHAFRGALGYGKHWHCGY